MMQTELLNDDRSLDPGEVADADSARLLGLEDLLPMLISPDTGAVLSRSSDRRWLEAPGEKFPIIDGLPLLYPARIQPYAKHGMLDIPPGGTDALAKYLHIAGLKQFEETNTALSDIHYRKHLHRSRELVSATAGTVLDIGCDDPGNSRRLFPATAEYVGLEPTYADRSQFRIIGIAEFLPFRNESFDNVALLTSLDHVLDYHTAIDEAWRVLKPGGGLFLATLIWTFDAQLYSDHIHFHHFREFEIMGVLQRFDIRSQHRYTWKGNQHRFGLYLSATK